MSIHRTPQEKAITRFVQITIIKDVSSLHTLRIIRLLAPFDGYKISTIRDKNVGTMIRCFSVTTCICDKDTAVGIWLESIGYSSSIMDEDI